MRRHVGSRTFIAKDEGRLRRYRCLRRRGDACACDAGMAAPRHANDRQRRPGLRPGCRLSHRGARAPSPHRRLRGPRLPAPQQRRSRDSIAVADRAPRWSSGRPLKRLHRLLLDPDPQVAVGVPAQREGFDERHISPGRISRGPGQPKEADEGRAHREVAAQRSARLDPLVRRIDVRGAAHARRRSADGRGALAGPARAGRIGGRRASPGRRGGPAPGPGADRCHQQPSRDGRGPVQPVARLHDGALGRRRARAHARRQARGTPCPIRAGGRRRRRPPRPRPGAAAARDGRSLAGPAVPRAHDASCCWRNGTRPVCRWRPRMQPTGAAADRRPMCSRHGRRSSSSRTASSKAASKPRRPGRSWRAGSVRHRVTSSARCHRWTRTGCIQEPSTPNSPPTHGSSGCAGAKPWPRRKRRWHAATQRPDVTVGLVYSQRGPAYSNMVSLNFSIPLQWDRENRQDRELAANLALVEQLRSEREEATRDVVVETLAHAAEAGRLPRAGTPLRRRARPAGHANGHARRWPPTAAGAARSSRCCRRAKRRSPAVSSGFGWRWKRRACGRRSISSCPSRRRRVSHEAAPDSSGASASSHCWPPPRGVAYRLGSERGGRRVAAATAVCRGDRAATPSGRVPQGHRRGRGGDPPPHRDRPEGRASSTPRPARKILYYHDPMVPGNRFDKPAKSPFMDMMLVPVYGGGGRRRAARSRVSPRIQQNLGVRTARGRGRHAGAAGRGGRQHRLQRARPGGRAGARHRLRREAARARHARPRSRRASRWPSSTCPNGSRRRRSFSPCGACRAPSLAPLVDGARQRMRLAGMSEEQIALVERSGQHAAADHAVARRSAAWSTELHGARGHDGDGRRDAVPHQRPRHRLGQRRGARKPGGAAAARRRCRRSSPAVPGVDFEGRVQALLPEVDAGTRTLKARHRTRQPGRRGWCRACSCTMQFMDLRSRQGAAGADRGGDPDRQAHGRDAGRGRRPFPPVDVRDRHRERRPDRDPRGLQAGQRVVVSSQFLIDSEASLRGRRGAAERAPAAPTAEPRAASGAGPAMIARADPLVDRQPLPGAAGDGDGDRLGRRRRAEHAARRAARPVRRAGDHPHHAIPARRRRSSRTRSPIR